MAKMIEYSIIGGFMFYLKKLSHQFKWLYKVYKINRKVLMLYFINTLEKPIAFQQDGQIIEFSRDSVTLKINKIISDFHIHKNNSVSLMVRFVDEKKASKTFFGKYLLFIEDSQITDNETLFYANEILNKIDDFLNKVIEEVLFAEPGLMQKYLTLNSRDFKNLKKKELINDFIPKDLKSKFLNDTLENNLNKEKIKQKVSKI
jgi:hypothetical protein